MYSLESPHRGDSNEYTQHAIIKIKKITLNYPKYDNVLSYGTVPYGLKNEFETAVVNEPSVFEPLKLYCKSFVKSGQSYATPINTVELQWLEHCWLLYRCSFEKSFLSPLEISHS